jgi:hypothetical protein
MLEANQIKAQIWDIVKYLDDMIDMYTEDAEEAAENGELDRAAYYNKIIATEQGYQAGLMRAWQIIDEAKD